MNLFAPILARPAFYFDKKAFYSKSLMTPFKHPIVKNGTAGINLPNYLNRRTSLTID
jgi:hypothetical protein